MNYRDKRFRISWAITALALLFSSSLLAGGGGEVQLRDFTGEWTGLLCLLAFAVTYLLVAGEEPLTLRKSKPMLVAAGVIWVLVAYTYTSVGDNHTAETLFRQNVEYYTELFLFLLAAMTFVNAMSERGIFAVFSSWLIKRSYSLRKIYWITGLLSFCLSAFVANLAVALLMAAILVAVAPGNKKFVALACVNIVVAANAGGVISPFGDVTSLMVWQRGLLDFEAFLTLTGPAVVGWLVPAIVMSFVLPGAEAQGVSEEVELREGAMVIVFLFVATLLATIWVESALNLPAVIGMMTGLGCLKLFGYYLKMRGTKHVSQSEAPGEVRKFDIFKSLERSEWDTLMFLFGIVAAVGGLSAMGYLMLASEFMYGQLGPTTANVLVGILSSIVENVPVMYSVLTMAPDMDSTQWLLVTLTAGIGGSLFSIGSASGVAVMGQARGMYTFMSHLRWTWVIALGYVASIGTHVMLNGLGG